LTGYPLAAQPGRERSLSCGCVAVEALEREISERGRFVLGPVGFVIIRACERGHEHVQLVDVLAAFEEAA
jgi:hypothetical protein